MWVIFCKYLEVLFTRCVPHATLIAQPAYCGRMYRKNGISHELTDCDDLEYLIAEKLNT